MIRNLYDEVDASPDNQSGGKRSRYSDLRDGIIVLETMRDKPQKTRSFIIEERVQKSFVRACPPVPFEWRHIFQK
jgi:Fe-S-cluster formation regulator IscX/YfhJ